MVALSPDRCLAPSSAPVVQDATGHARRLVKFDSDFTPGYQARTRIRSKGTTQHTHWRTLCAAFVTETSLPSLAFSCTQQALAA